MLRQSKTQINKDFRLYKKNKDEINLVDDHFKLLEMIKKYKRINIKSPSLKEMQAFMFYGYGNNSRKIKKLLFELHYSKFIELRKKGRTSKFEIKIIK